MDRRELLGLYKLGCRNAQQGHLQCLGRLQSWHGHGLFQHNREKRALVFKLKTYLTSTVKQTKLPDRTDLGLRSDCHIFLCVLSNFFKAKKYIINNVKQCGFSSRLCSFQFLEHFSSPYYAFMLQGEWHDHSSIEKMIILEGDMALLTGHICEINLWKIICKN